MKKSFARPGFCTVEVNSYREALVRTFLEQFAER
jgi:hypothetical protein